MSQDRPRIVLWLYKKFGDPDYDTLLTEFREVHPIEYARWEEMERDLFLRRDERGAHPDKQLMEFCERFIADRSEDEWGGLGPFVAWSVLRGRILGNLLRNDVALNPAPGKILITKPRTCSDEEVAWLAASFQADLPEVWVRWQNIEDQNDFSDDPLNAISEQFRTFVYEHCWVQTYDAYLKVWSDVRTLVGGYYERANHRRLNRGAN